MSQETNQNTQNPNSTAGNSQTNSQANNKSGEQLLNELDRLGNQLVGVLRSAWHSDQRKHLEEDLSKGLNEIIKGIDAGVKRIGESEHARDILNKAEEVMSQAGEQIRSKVTPDVTEGLRKGLQGINDQLAKFAQDLKSTKSTTPPQNNPPEQEIKVEKEG